MKLADVDRLQSALWRSRLSEVAEVIDHAGAVLSAHRTISDPPFSATPPGTELSYESAVEVLVFNRLDRPHLPRGSKLRWRGSTWTVDQVAKRDDHTLAPA